MKHRSQMMERCMRLMKQRGHATSMGNKIDGMEQMCRSMMGDNQASDELSTYATPELRTLFEDWLLQLEEEIFNFAKDKETVNPQQVANAFKLSKESATFVLKKLAKKESITIEGI